MKKIIPFLALLMLSFAGFSQESKNNSPLPVKQLHSSDSIVKYGRILSAEEVQAEYINMNHALLKFKKINGFGYASAVGSAGLAIAGIQTKEDEMLKKSCLIGSAVFGVTSFVLFIIANEQLYFDKLYITPTGVVYKF